MASARRRKAVSTCSEIGERGPSHFIVSHPEPQAAAGSLAGLKAKGSKPTAGRPACSAETDSQAMAAASSFGVLQDTLCAGKFEKMQSTCTVIMQT